VKTEPDADSIGLEGRREKKKKTEGGRKKREKKEMPIEHHFWDSQERPATGNSSYEARNEKKEDQHDQINLTCAARGASIRKV